jgi:hypothetical protein
MNYDESRADHIAFAKELTTWLTRAAVQAPISGADFADVVFGARTVDRCLRELLQCDPRTEAGADRAASLLGRIHAWLFSEIKNHLADLESAWPSLESRLAELSEERTAE